MPANRKYPIEMLKGLIEEYVASMPSYKKLVYADIVAFCKERYPNMYDLNYQHFSRCEELKKYISGYNDRLESRLLDINMSEMSVHEKYLDAREFYGKKNTEIDRIISKLNEDLSNLYKEFNHLYKSNVDKSKKNRDLKKKCEYIQNEKDELTAKAQDDKKTIRDLEKKNKELRAEKNNVIKYLNEHLYSPTIQQHMIELGYLKEIDQEAANQEEDITATSLEKIVTNDILTKAEGDALYKLSRMGMDDEV